MKIKALTSCTGEGYENLKAEEEREVTAEVGKLLESYGYAEILEEEKTELETKSYEEVKDIAKNLGIPVFGVSKDALIQKITELSNK